ncbi:pyridoxal-dependent decarboxylase [Bacillus carboniphilus]|uniref:Pyridoxal-dependent decarboxylase n=1 Tax=Bacillus carboniphilus TaxID=86663 RepID=A0ABY9JUP5_9BACI|nr:pyridoxal-dependent decarboxylase [Bacillus carboniphilus]WLR43134.1 pyridoxal-dependent decarboxylase [Bacillus carboniphilus]
MNKKSFDHLFINHGSIKDYESYLKETVSRLAEALSMQQGPFNGAKPAELIKKIEKASTFTNESEDWLGKVMKTVTEVVVPSSFQVHHSRCMAHLHCPPLIPAIAAEIILSSLNQSMDSWDQSGVATLIEEEMISWLTELFHFPNGDGTFTSGGTQSNLMGILLAREHFSAKNWNWNTRKQGMHPEAHKLKIICSEHAHFTVKQSAALLGVGEDAVVTVPVDENQKMSLTDLDETIAQLKESGSLPFVIVATAGTTDYGSIDPIEDISKRASKEGIWLHVDAHTEGLFN